MDDGASKDSTHYTAAQLREVRWSQTGFITQEVSWNEQRLQLNAIRTSLGEWQAQVAHTSCRQQGQTTCHGHSPHNIEYGHTLSESCCWYRLNETGPSSALGQSIDRELAVITGPAAMGPLIPPSSSARADVSGAQWQAVPRALWGSTFTMNTIRLAIDPITGAIISLRTGATTTTAPPDKGWAGAEAITHLRADQDWATSSSPIARFAYAAHDDAQAEAFFANYSFGCPRCGWAKEAFSKPGENTIYTIALMTCDLKNPSLIWQDRLGRDCTAMIHYLHCDVKRQRRGHARACQRFGRFWHRRRSLGKNNCHWGCRQRQQQ